MRIKLLVVLILSVLLISIASCDGFVKDFAEDSELPTNLGIDETEQLGNGPVAWVSPNYWIFEYDPMSSMLIVFYNIDTGEISTLHPPEITLMASIDVSSDGTLIGYNNIRDGFSIYEISTEKVSQTSRATFFSFSDDNQKGALGKYEDLYVIDLESGQEDLIYQITPTLFWDKLIRYTRISWRPNSDQVTIKIKDLAEKDESRLILIDSISKEITEIVDNKDLYSFDWSPDGKFLAYSIGSHFSGSLYIFDMGKGCPIYKINKPIGITPLWSPDGNFIFLGYSSDKVEILDMGSVLSDIDVREKCIE